MSDESVRRRVKAFQQAAEQQRRGPRRLVPLERAEALWLLASVPFGRVVFTQRALPAIRPVNHVVVDDAIIIRTHEGAALATTAQNGDPSGVVLAYEADVIDAETHVGWSVVVTGFAEVVTDPAELNRYESLVRPWIDGVMDSAIRIRPELVTGFRLARV